MTNYTMNIGLHVSTFIAEQNSRPAEELNRDLRNLVFQLMFGLNEFRSDLNIEYLTVVEVGECDKISEPTMVIYFDTTLTEQQVQDDIVMNLAKLTAQDCIAIKNNSTGEGVLIGERASQWGSFDGNYFVEKKDIKNKPNLT